MTLSEECETSDIKVPAEAEMVTGGQFWYQHIRLEKTGGHAMEVLTTLDCISHRRPAILWECISWQAPDGTTDHGNLH